MIEIQKILDCTDLFDLNTNLSDEEKIFIYFYSFKQMKMADIELELKKYDINKKYEDVQRLVKECKEYTSNIQNIRKKFKEKRKEDFNNDFQLFYNWFKKQKDCCGYCGITQEELHNIFTNDEHKILPLNDNWSKNDKGTLQIERLNSKTNSYNENNIILACPLCNNAKSNLIDEDSWRDLFVIPMRAYYEKLLNKELKNPIPNKN